MTASPSERLARGVVVQIRLGGQPAERAAGVRERRDVVRGCVIARGPTVQSVAQGFVDQTPGHLGYGALLIPSQDFQRFV